MSLIRSSISNLIGRFDNFSVSSKLALIVTLLIFAAIPITVIGLFEVRTLSSQAAADKPEQLKLINSTQGTSEPVFSWSCYCSTGSYRVYLREVSNQFSSGNYWYKDVTTSTTDWLGWKNVGTYTTFRGFSTKTYYWTVGCTPGYGSCSNSDSQSFLIDTPQ